MSEQFSSGTINNKQTNKSLRKKPFCVRNNNETYVGRGIVLGWLDHDNLTVMTLNSLDFTLKNQRLTQVKGQHLLCLFDGSSI